MNVDTFTLTKEGHCAKNGSEKVQDTLPLFFAHYFLCLDLPKYLEQVRTTILNKS